VEGRSRICRPGDAGRGVIGIWQYADKKKQTNREPFNNAQMEH